MLSIREFNFSDEEDYKFTYEILLRRYSNPDSLIEGITPMEIPTYVEHKNNIKVRFIVMKIALLNNYPVGIGYIDRNNLVGFSYHYSKLKTALRTVKERDIDFSEFYLKAILSFADNNPLFAQVSTRNKLGNRTASRLMKLVSKTNTHNTYTYNNE